MNILNLLGGVRPYSTEILQKGGRANYALISGKEEVGKGGDSRG